MKIVRFLLIIALAAGFAFLAYYLYERQKNAYHFLTFQVAEPNENIVIPNVDRLLKKWRTESSLSVFEGNELVSEGIAALMQESVKLNDVMGESVLLSMNENEFSLTIENPDLDFYDLATYLSSTFEINSAYANNQLQIGEHRFYAQHYGVYGVISSVEIAPTKRPGISMLSNADYIVLNDSAVDFRTIITGHQEFEVRNQSAKPVRGAPLSHNELIVRVPANFQSLHFYGSTRFQEDKFSFFDAPQETAFDWIGDQLVLIKKDSFEVVIARPDLARDLRLILEEEALNGIADSIPLTSVNLKNTEIMSFETNFNWTSAIPNLTSDLTHFTEFENYNILTNSLGAMQWYLSQVQLANLIGDQAELYQLYRQSTPIKSHQIAIMQTAEELQFESTIWIEKNRCTKAKTRLSTVERTTVPSGKSFDSPFIPNFIQPFKTNNQAYILLSNDRKAAVYSNQGEPIWNYELPSDLIQKPVIIDLENDGKFEFAFFMKNHFLVLNKQGKVAGSLNIKLNEQIVGGLCANYDQKYDYRFFVITPSAVKLYNERGQIVTGWTFNSGGVQLTGESAYTQIAGKDYISFLGTNDQLFVLNRRGENRFSQAIVPKLKNESRFITGKNQENLHKLGYDNQHIFMHYLKDGTTDSLKLDKTVNGIGERWIMLDKPHLLVEEPARILLFDTFGYVVEEILKPQGGAAFIGLESSPAIRFLFFSNANNSLYLLEGDGKIILSAPTTNSAVYGINATHFYTFDGKKINEHNLN